MPKMFAPCCGGLLRQGCEGANHTGCLLVCPLDMTNASWISSWGAFARHNKLYEINMACRPDDTGLATRKLLVVPLHEALREELVADRPFHQRAEEAL